MPIFYEGPRDQYVKEYTNMGELTEKTLNEASLWCRFAIIDFRPGGKRKMRLVTNFQEFSAANVFHIWRQSYTAVDLSRPDEGGLGEIIVLVIADNDDMPRAAVRSIIFGACHQSICCCRTNGTMRYVDAPDTEFSVSTHELEGETIERTLYSEGDKIEYRGLSKDLNGVVGYLDDWRREYRDSYPNCKFTIYSMDYAVDGLPIGDGTPMGDANQMSFEVSLCYGATGSLDGGAWRQATSVLPFVRFDPESGKFEPGHFVIDLSLPDACQAEMFALAREVGGWLSKWYENELGVLSLMVVSNGFIEVRDSCQVEDFVRNFHQNIL